MVDRYAKFATENLAFAASRIELGREGSNVVNLSRFCHVPEMKKAHIAVSLLVSGSSTWARTRDTRINSL